MPEFIHRHQLPKSPELDLKSGAYSRIIRNLGLQNIRLPYARNAEELQEARAAEQIAYLAGWSYIVVGHSRYRIPFSDLFGVVIPHKGRAGLKKFFDSTQLFVWARPNTTTPLPTLSEVAAMGLLSIAPEDSELHQSLVIQAETSSTVQGYLNSGEYLNICTLSPEMQIQLQADFYQALANQVREDRACTRDRITRDGLAVFLAQSTALDAGDAFQRGAHRPHEIAFRDGVKAAQKILPTMPKHPFGDFLLNQPPEFFR